MTNNSMVTGNRCVDEETDKWFLESLFKDYKELLFVLSWGNLSMLAFVSALFSLFWYRYRPFRIFNNYIILNLLFSLSMFNAAKIVQLFFFDHATSASKQTSLFFIRLSMGWFSSWFFVLCFLVCLNHAAKGLYVLNHKYWKTNTLAVLSALLLTLCPAYLSLKHYPVLLALITLPAYAAYLTTIMTIIEVLVTEKIRIFHYQIVKSFTYHTCGLFILGTMQLGEYDPYWYNYSWLCMVGAQMFLFVFYLAMGDFYTMHIQCRKDQIKPIVSDGKNEVELVTVMKDDK